MHDHEAMRKQLWINVAAAVAGAIDTKSSDVPSSWANNTLAAFDAKFPAPAVINTPCGIEVRNA